MGQKILPKQSKPINTNHHTGEKIMTETLHFSVDGEFITDLARRLLWEDRRPYAQAAALLEDCCDGIPEDQKNEIIVSILEGRKKLVGINEFTLEDDNEEIRPLSLLITKQERTIWLHEIEDDMQANFIRYVDPYSTIKSMHPQSLACSGNPHTWAECKHYFTTDVNGRTIPVTTKQPTFGGLWLRQEADLICEITNGDLHGIGSDHFWEQIYEHIKDDPDFQDRNNRYLAVKRMREEKENRDLLWERLMRTEQKENSEPEYFSDEWFLYKEKTEHDISYRLTPDDIECWEGLIAPNGDFYSCGFGHHAAKAWHLIAKYPEKFGIQITPDTQPYDIYPGDIEKCLDIIIEKGWCATREICGSYYCTLPIRPTKAQINRIFEAMLKHDIRMDTTELMQNDY